HIVSSSLPPPPPTPPLCPYTTLFRSHRPHGRDQPHPGPYRRPLAGPHGPPGREEGRTHPPGRRMAHPRPRLRGRPHRTAGQEHRSEEHTSELQSRFDLVCRLLLEKKK